MIPCRLFLQKCIITPEPHSLKKVKIVLTQNSIYYDEIHPFQSRYFCLSSQDIIGVQISIEQHELLLGQTSIQNAFRLALQSQTISIKFKSPSHLRDVFQQIDLIFMIQPVTYFKNRKLRQTTDKGIQTNRGKQKVMRGDYQYENENIEISFSHHDGLIESERNIPKELFGNTGNSSNIGKSTYRESMRKGYNQTLKEPLIYEQNSQQSLESLAHQREKLLGELFGKLKRQNKNQP